MMNTTLNKKDQYMKKSSQSDSHSLAFTKGAKAKMSFRDQLARSEKQKKQSKTNIDIQKREKNEAKSQNNYTEALGKNRGSLQGLSINKHTQSKMGPKEKFKSKTEVNNNSVNNNSESPIKKKTNFLQLKKRDMALALAAKARVVKNFVPRSVVAQTLKKPRIFKNELKPLRPLVRMPLRGIEPIYKKKRRQRPIVGASTVVGFKKQLFNQVMAQGDKLFPAFNRRKHNHTYAMVVNNHRIRLSKAFHYLSENQMAFYTGFALKAAHQMTAVSSRGKTLIRRAIPFLLSVIESDTALLLYRCQDQFFLRKSRQSINHGEWKPRAQRFFSFAFAPSTRVNAIQKPQEIFGLNTPKKHSRWLKVGGVLRTL